MPRDYAKTSLYVRAAPGLRLRDHKVQRLVQRMRQAMPWLKNSDVPMCRSWAQLEVLADAVFAVLRSAGPVTPNLEARRLLDDFRKLRASQVPMAMALGMTPVARMQLRVGGEASADATYATISEQHAEAVIAAHEQRDITEAETDETLAPGDGNPAPGDDSTET